MMNEFEVYYCNIHTGELALSNDEWLWLPYPNTEDAQIPPDDVIFDLIGRQIEEWNGWRVALVIDHEVEGIAVPLSEELFDQLYLKLTPSQRAWEITNADTGENAEYQVYLQAILMSTFYEPVR